jgi:hypothetical protein
MYICLVYLCTIYLAEKLLSCLGRVRRAHSVWPTLQMPCAIWFASRSKYFARTHTHIYTQPTSEGTLLLDSLCAPFQQSQTGDLWPKTCSKSRSNEACVKRRWHMSRVGHNHIYTVYIRYFWLGNHQIYSHVRCIYTVLANLTHEGLQHIMIRCVCVCVFACVCVYHVCV